ncbi:30S ribosomal protein S6e [Candidatus Woesearchaeota archaeon]|nr:30S ribosomal protein S6e [Candidatus Woesearchaeota archaeon]|tara:strand:+ start:3113 stop:3706 length:594 start_codon:yes stop_codon:yes gene_type:complete
MAFKLVISDPKSGISIQKEAAEEASKNFLGLKIGDSVKGELIDLTGYEFTLTGGSDYCGFPMRKDVPGVGRKKILAFQGVGVKKLKKGILQRKTVCGNTVHPKTSQINLKVVKLGAENIFSGAGKKEGKEEKKEEKGKEEAKDVKKDAEVKEEKPEVKKETPAPPAKEPQKQEKKADAIPDKAQKKPEVNEEKPESK